MKSIAVILMVLVAFFAEAAPKDEFSVKVFPVENLEITASENTLFHIKSEIPEDWQIKAVNFWAYKKNLPPDFCDLTGIKADKKTDPPHETILILPWRWFSGPAKKTELIEFKLSTLKWPKGDYAISWSVLMQATDKSKKQQDKYAGGHFFFTVK